MYSTAPIVVPEGDSIGLEMKWSELLTTDLEDPTMVTYQVFDKKTRAAVSTVQTVAGPAAEMTITIPASHLPAGSIAPHALRYLVVQITGYFSSNTHTEQVLIAVHKGY